MQRVCVCLCAVQVTQEEVQSDVAPDSSSDGMQQRAAAPGAAPAGAMTREAPPGRAVGADEELQCALALVRHMEEQLAAKDAANARLRG